MLEIKCRKYSRTELEEIARLFAETLSSDGAFAAAFPGGEARLEHARGFVGEYSKTGEIHTAFEGGVFKAAALWTLPYRRVPSPVFDFEYEEPCCKLYLLASREKGLGDALMRFALFRYASPPLLLVCAAEWQAAYFSRYGFKPAGRTGFGLVMLNDRQTQAQKRCES